jgi:DNA (cytosine-5)-methyltransferase 1
LRPVRSQRTDDRNELFRVMLQAAAVLRPKIILLENVREIITYNDGAIISEIEEALATNYTIAVRILNAADYGVPQMRRRAFIVAVRNDIRGETLAEAFFPLPTHIATSETVGLKTLQGDRGKHVTVWEAIGDLPLPRAVSGTRSREATLQKLTITGYRRFVGRSGSVKNHEERALSKRVLARLKAMKPGMRSHHLPKKLRTRKFFYNAYARLEWNRPANTITKSFVNLGSGKFGHPDQDRGVTIREAARLQSFPDDFQFCDASLKTLATMVGGAVPPLLAKAFGLRIAALLDEKANRKRSPSHSQRKQFSRHTAVKKIKRRRS